MPRWNLSDLSKKSAKNQAEAIAQMGPQTAFQYPPETMSKIKEQISRPLPVSLSSPTPADETPPERKEPAAQPHPDLTVSPTKDPYLRPDVISKDGLFEGYARGDGQYFWIPRAEHSAIDQTPIDVPAELIRFILDNFSAAFYVAKDETQRRAVVKHAVQVLARREANPHSIP